MAWIYSELTKEASRRGGPVALRYFYRSQGLVLGVALTSAAIAGTVAHDKWSKRRDAAERAPDNTAEAPVSQTSGHTP